MTTPWAHLPNAPHIDRVLASVRANPQRWTAALAAARGAWADARDASWRAARGVALGAALDAARDAARDVARDAAWGACAALIAWDDCAELLDMPPDAVRLLAATGHHPAVLLLPAVLALTEENINENDSA